MTTQPTGYNSESLTETERTFLDDVPEEQIDEFLEYIESGRMKITKWFFSNPYKVIGFTNERYSDVGDYFRYLRSLNAS